MKKINSIFLMALTAVRRIIAVLDFPKDIDDFITYSNSIHDSMGASSFFSTLSAKLTALATAIGNLVTAHNGLQTTPPTTTTAQRNSMLNIVQNQLRTLRGDVQAIADADPDHAQEIIEEAGMKVKEFGAINKQDLEARDSGISGTVKLVAKAADTVRSAHDWAMSPDGTNWTPLTPTLAATTNVEGLHPGAIMDFRHRYILKDGPTDWVEVHDFVVK